MGASHSATQPLLRVAEWLSGWMAASRFAARARAIKKSKVQERDASGGIGICSTYHWSPGCLECSGKHASKKRASTVIWMRRHFRHRNGGGISYHHPPHPHHHHHHHHPPSPTITHHHHNSQKFMFMFFLFCCFCCCFSRWFSRVVSIFLRLNCMMLFLIQKGSELSVQAKLQNAVADSAGDSAG